MRSMSLNLADAFCNPIKLISLAPKEKNIGFGSTEVMGLHLLFPGQRGNTFHNAIGYRNDGLCTPLVESELLITDGWNCTVEIQQETDGAATPRLDILRIVTDDNDTRSRMPHTLQQAPLNRINVLKFIHDNLSQAANPFAPPLRAEPLGPSYGQLVDEVLIGTGVLTVSTENIASQGMESACPQTNWSNEAPHTVQHLSGGVTAEGKEDDLVG